MTYKRKLIEVALPLEDINREAAREKSIRHGHPSTLHLWWARRPLAACRAVLFASLVDDPSEYVAELLKVSARRTAAEKELKARKKLWDEMTTVLEKARARGISAPPPGPEPKLEEVIAEIERERLFDIIRELVKWENSNNERVLNAARAEIMRSCNGNPPPVYDPFCGGGSIPLEAQRLGLEAHASDLNPVPVLINKALIEIPPKFTGQPPVNPEARKKLGASGSWSGASGLAEDIRYYGQWMRDEAEKRIGHLYPRVKLPKDLGGGDATVIAWLWARTVSSPNPAAKGAHVPLVRSFWLSTKAGKKAWIEPVVNQSTMTYQFEVRTGNGEPRAGLVGRNGGVCLLTGSPIPLEYIRAEGKAGRLGTRLLAVVAEGHKGRLYISPSEDQEHVALTAQPQNAPDTDLPEQALGFRVQNYGMTKHRHLFTKRQLTALTTFSDLVVKSRDFVFKDSNDQAYADAVATYLSFAVGRGADKWASLTIWNSVGEKIEHVFGRNALSMTWDFPEGNIFSDSTGNWASGVEWVWKSVKLLPASMQGHVRQLPAQELPLAKRFVFSTDPPYYDNVPYADLSDFFYVWLRQCLKAVYPQLLGTVLVPKAEELVAEPFRHGSKEAARVFFEKGMGNVFGRMREASEVAFPTTIYYAFKQAEGEDEDSANNASRASTGWETFLQGLIDGGWQLDGTWPLRTERPGRLRDQGSNALASSIVLVCRPRQKDAGIASRREFLTALKKELPEALRHLQKGNIAPVDLAQAAIGPGMAVFSRFTKVMESDGSSMTVRSALAEINRCLDEVLAEQEGEFDGDTRWALAWFEQSGFGDGPYGTAETLSTAKNTSVKGLEEAGILVSKSGRVRLLRSEELAPDWDPNTDLRFTVWEATHHLSRVIEIGGVEKAAELAARLGSARSETARDLAYRLYSVCERRKWSQDAIAYNNLVIAWPEITQAAAKLAIIRPSQTDLNL